MSFPEFSMRNFSSAGYDRNALHCFFAGELAVLPERNAIFMNKQMTAALLSAAAGTLLLTGCGSNQNMTNAEAPYTTAVTEPARRTETSAARETDRDNSLYEEDDVHRNTEVSEPNIVDRAESAMDKAEDIVTSLMTDAKEKLDETN